MKSAKNFYPKKVTLTSVDGKEINITPAVVAFSYYEDIFQPFCTGNMLIVDSGMNLIGNLPIQGGEKVKIQLDNIKKEEVEYEMCIWKVYNRKFEKNMQYYTLSLVSEEAIINQSARVLDKIKGKSEAIISTILKDILKTKKELYAETSKFQFNLQPNGRKAHAICQSLMSRTVPMATKFKKGKKTEQKKGESGLGANASKAQGTAGYLFFENKDGFIFQSMDKLCSDGTDSFGGTAPIATYYSRPALDLAPEDVFLTIEEYRFPDEIDIMDKLNNGIFSTHMCYFDVASQKYEEYTYDMASTFNNMSHLGSQDKLPMYQEEQTKNPSRVMTVLLDHEMWYDGEDVANPDEDGDADFPDYAKYYTAQAIGRRYMMENQKVEITIPGNSDMKVGDKIKIMLPNMVAQNLRDKEPYDEENSGTYLVAQLSHNYQHVVESGNPQFVTRVALIRDTYGIKEYESKVK